MILHSLIQLAQSSVDMSDVVYQFLPEFTDRPEIDGLFQEFYTLRVDFIILENLKKSFFLTLTFLMVPHLCSQFQVP